MLEALRCEAATEGLLWRGDADAALAAVLRHVEVACSSTAMPGSCPQQVRLLCEAELARSQRPAGAAPGP